MSGTYFYAVELHLPKALEFVEQCKSRVPRATWTDKDKMHLTVLFRGKTCPESHQEVEAFRQLCCETTPLLVKARGCGIFNNRSGPRVLFARVEPQDSLKTWHAALGGNPGTYTPHLTLAKLEDIGDADPEFANLAQEYHALDFGAALVGELRLYQTQGEGRPYRVVAWHRFCGSSQER